MPTNCSALYILISYYIILNRKLKDCFTPERHFCELTMMQGYYEKDQNETVIFDVFYRQNPCNGGYAICAGLEQVIEYVKGLNFTYEDVDYLRSLGIFDEEFLHYLSGFHFSGDIYAIPEGSVIFPKEPLLKVVAPITAALAP